MLGLGRGGVKSIDCRLKGKIKNPVDIFGRSLYEEARGIFYKTASLFEAVFFFGIFGGVIPLAALERRGGFQGNSPDFFPALGLCPDLCPIGVKRMLFELECSRKKVSPDPFKKLSKKERPDRTASPLM